jgi:hypothetical protein
MHITPYKFMKKGLVSHIFENFNKILMPEIVGDSTYQSFASYDTVIKQNILSSFAIALNLTDIRDEIKGKLLSSNNDNLLVFLLSKGTNNSETFSLKES